MGAGRAVVAASGTASAGLSSAAGAESGRDGRDSVGAADGDAVERVERDRDLLLVGGAGIGFLLFNSIQLFQYKDAAMELTVMLVLLLAVERISTLLRARIV